MPVDDPSFFSSQPLRVLCVLANPSDLPRFDENGLWREISAAFEPLITRCSLVMERLAEPTESALKRSLAQNQWHVLHFVVHAEERAEANYGAIALNSTDGHARHLTASYIAELIGGNAAVRVVVLQAADPSSGRFQTFVNVLATRLSAVVTVSPLNGSAARIFVSKLYSGLLAGLDPDSVRKEVWAALAYENIGSESIRIFSRNSTAPIFPVAKAQAAASSAFGATGAQDQNKIQVADTKPSWIETLQRKRATGQFDVFLCHHSADKPAVKRIAQLIKEAGILPWLDVWELPPGLPWQPLLERQIGNIKSAAVFIGSTGFGPWQEQEINAFLRAFVKRNMPVIPVMLADAPSQPGLPPFLEGMGWVDFRNDDPDPMTMLIWGITGNRPED